MSVPQDLAVMRQRSGNIRDLGEAGNERCSVCKDLLAHIERFFAVVQNARGAPGSDWLTVDDIASELKVSKSIVYRLIRSGELEAVNIVDTGRRIAAKGHYRIKRSSLDNYLEIKKVHPLPAAPNRKHAPRQFPKVKNHLGI